MAAPGFTSLPVMGYNTWYEWRTAISESMVLDQALRMVDAGLVDAGYNCFNLDDTWSETTRSSSGTLWWDSDKFPSGMPCLACKLHSLGFNFGIYTAIGTRTCQDYPGAYGYYAEDAKTYADWGVDLVKVDLCGGYPDGVTGSDDATITLFEDFGGELYDANPNVYYSQELPIGVIGTADFVPHTTAGAAFSNMWRVAHDEYPLSDANSYPMFMEHIDQTRLVEDIATAWHWNDLDMVAPNYPASGWTFAHLQDQMGIWAMFSSPLLISCDFSKCGQDAINLFKDPYIIAIDQSGEQVTNNLLVSHVWAFWKDTSLGKAILFVNTGTGAASASFALTDFGITDTWATGYQVYYKTSTNFTGFSLTLGAYRTQLVVITDTWT